jgi:acyl-coenzyme A synthetase/AMP-(fatty) acid ligase
MIDRYWSAAGAGEPATRGGWFYPGDWGVLAADGLLSITGRVSDTINIGGVKLAPAAIEAELDQIAGVAESAVAHFSPGDGHEYLVVATVTAPDTDWPRIEALVGGVMRGRPPYMNVRLPRLPRNDAGKLDRAAPVRQLTPVLHALEKSRRS